MAFRPEAQQPDYSDLIVSLDNSKIQIKNNALYQTIFLLIQRAERSKLLFMKKLEELEAEIAALENAAFRLIEANLGATPAWRGSFTIVDTDIVATSIVVIKQAPGPYTGKGTRADEAEMDQLWCIAVPGFHQATVLWRTVNGVGNSFSEIRGNQPSDFSEPFYASLTNHIIGRVKGNFKFQYSVTQP